MKRVFILMAGIMTAASAFAQLSVGIQATGTLSDASLKSDFIEVTKKTRVLPGAGVVADLKVSPHITLRSGVNFLQHGVKLKSELGGVGGEFEFVKTESTGSINYLQVPVNLLVTTKGAVQFYAGGGPYFSYAVSGKSKQTTTTGYSDGSTETEKEEWDIFEKGSAGDAAFKRADFGIGVLAGVKLPGGFFANAGYQMSLSNASDTQGEKYKNRGLQVSVGYYLFGR